MGFSENMCEKEDHYRVVRLTWNNNPSLGEIPMKVALSLSQCAVAAAANHISSGESFSVTTFQSTGAIRIMIWG